jgi:hypothetical protein
LSRAYNTKNCVITIALVALDSIGSFNPCNMITNPTKRDFAGMGHEKLLTNCPITVCNMDNANQIFRPNLANLRGKTARAKPGHIRVKYTRTPKDFIQLPKYVTLVADVMFVNGLPFLVTSLWGISLVIIKHLPSQTDKHLVHT